MASSLRASPQGLKTVDQARIRKGWDRQSAAWANAAKASVATLKRFWQKKYIQAQFFLDICAAVGVDWQEIVDSFANEDWDEAPDVPVFYGRTEELATLQQWIVQDRCRVVALLGMGGIGKTALAVRCVEQIKGEFEYFVWRSLTTSHWASTLRHPPSASDLLASLLFFFHQEQDNQATLSKLVDYLRQHRCLVVLDDLDAILDSAGEEYEGYREIIKRLGEERDLPSCLILTSQQKPKEIVLLEGKKLPVRSFLLSGLGEAAHEILNEAELTYKPQQGLELIQMYRGNPLALKIVSQTIKDLFGGSVVEFLRYNTIVLGDIFRDILDLQFQRLSELEKKVMHALVIYQQPIALQQLKEKISSTVSTSEIIEALDSLSRRSLIEISKEQSNVVYTLQPVVMKYVRRVYSQAL
ncbi:NB-ARC domain-containing protein [Brasilonema sp. UFV-L1]|uniref:NB-ARC domain-containing protein n=1 Tax=Brasilonema sp. UFV-L1 TaxID=2234130 RepID=UPI00145F5802|nr:NB-ARC domain-containing protein [Brasilonema sp. UFV-L1]